MNQVNDKPVEVLVLTKNYLSQLFNIYDLSNREDMLCTDPLKPVENGFGYYGALAVRHFANDDSEQVAIDSMGSVIDPQTGKLYSGPIEDMEGYADNINLQNTLLEVQEFIHSKYIQAFGE